MTNGAAALAVAEWTEESATHNFKENRCSKTKVTHFQSENFTHFGGASALRPVAGGGRGRGVPLPLPVST